MNTTSTPRRQRNLIRRSGVRLAACGLIGVLAGAAYGANGHGLIHGTMGGWLAGAVTFAAWTWLGVRGMDHHEAASHAKEEDNSVVVTDILLFGASFASLVGVGFLLSAGGGHGAGTLEAVLGAASVVAAWFLVHIVWMLRYARLYYGDGPGHHGINFPGGEPDYYDFAYLSFCLGMTYQISDTNTQDREMRRQVLRHTMLSYLYGAGIIATTINLVVSLAQGS